MSNEITSSEYWTDIKDYATEIMEEAIEEDPQDPEEGIDLHDRIHESVDGACWIIYTHRALKVMEYSDNTEAYEDLGPIPEGKSWPEIVTYCAFWAMRQDVTDALQGLIETYEPPEEDEDEDEDAEEQIPRTPVETEARALALLALADYDDDAYTVEHNEYSGRGMNGTTSPLSIIVNCPHAFGVVGKELRRLGLLVDNMGLGFVFYLRPGAEA